MFTLKTVKPLFLPLAMMSGLVAMAPASAEMADHAAHHQSSSVIDREWPGVYVGLTPCADCFGVKTTIALNKAGTYIMMYKYAGKSEREYTEKGKFQAGEKNDTIVLTSRDGSKVRHYHVEEASLTELDDKGNFYTGKEASRYVLKANTMSETAPESHGH